jgi:hypothetical protein
MSTKLSCEKAKETDTALMSLGTSNRPMREEYSYGDSAAGVDYGWPSRKDAT